MPVIVMQHLPLEGKANGFCFFLLSFFKSSWKTKLLDRIFIISQQASRSKSGVKKRELQSGGRAGRLSYLSGTHMYARSSLQYHYYLEYHNIQYVVIHLEVAQQFSQLLQVASVTLTASQALKRLSPATSTVFVYLN